MRARLNKIVIVLLLAVAQSERFQGERRSAPGRLRATGSASCADLTMNASYC